jgi:hypothetical protein
MIVAQLNIMLDDAGQVQVNGTIDNKLYAYGLLELAKEAIQIHVANAQKAIVAPGPGGLALVGGNGLGKKP